MEVQTCVYCEKAHAVLTEMGVQYVYLDVKASEKAFKDFRNIGGRRVPTIVWKSGRMEGYNETKIRRSLVGFANVQEVRDD